MLNPTTAKPPKDGTAIIAKFKESEIKRIAVWNSAHDKWVTATLQAETCEEGVDCYFENEYYNDDELIAWDELN